jgi:glucose/arabinose dehydrogenase
VRRALLLFGLVASVRCSGSHPVDPVLPGDSAAVRDSMAARDSIARDSVRRDSVVAPVALKLTAVASGLSAPVYTAAPSGDTRLFVVELAGRILIIRNGQVLPTPFLDLRNNVLTGDERGMLSMAFHPAYQSSGFFYVYYTDRGGDIQLQRFTVSSDPDVANPASGTPLLSLEHSANSNHNGGLVQFGPDGLLYIGVGDGGGAGDPAGNAQNRGSLLGKILRMNVNGGEPSPTAEVWAYGLRNPWRFSFDVPGNLLYIADVGQFKYEEVNVARADQEGVNYGWSVMEGRHCFASPNCTPIGVAPVIEYDHSGGCSVTGGPVYRGKAMPGLTGHYFYSDYCGGWLKSFRSLGGEAVDERTWDVKDIGPVPSFGEDAAGEMYMLAADGTVYRIDPQ